MRSVRSILLAVSVVVAGSPLVRTPRVAVANKVDSPRVELPDDEAVAKWLIEVAGRVKVEHRIEGGTRVDTFTAAAQLPETPYKIYEVDFRQVKGRGVVDLRRLSTIPHIRVLWLDETRADDAGLAFVGKIVRLQHLSLQGCNVTDLGLHELRSLRLRSISLASTRITDAGLAALREMEGMTQLQLSDTRVSDQGLTQLRGLKAMYNLDLGDTNVTDEGLRHLAAMSNLHFLDIGAAQISDAGMKHLTHFQKLESLNLGKAAISEVGLRELADLPALKTLILSGTQLSAASLKQLAAMDRLTRLDLYGCGVTFDDAAELKAALPKCLVQGVPTRP